MKKGRRKEGERVSEGRVEDEEGMGLREGMILIDDEEWVDLNEGMIVIEDDEEGVNEGMIENNEHFGIELIDRYERIRFFGRLADSLAACKSYQELTEKCHNFQESMLGYMLPEGPVHSDCTGRDIDQGAADILPEEIKRQCVPLSVPADGNCFYSSLSMLLFGNIEHHRELRVRTVVAMCTRKELFLDGRNWCSNADRLDPIEVQEVAVMTSVAPDDEHKVAFESETLHAAKNARYAGLWQMFAASAAINRPILSVFPHMGWPLYQRHCNRIICAPGCTSNLKVTIFWTSSRNDLNIDHWIPNHFTPLFFPVQV